MELPAKSVRRTITSVCALVSCGKSQQGIGTFPTAMVVGWGTLCVCGRGPAARVVLCDDAVVT
jgi:hypothetical protein